MNLDEARMMALRLMRQHNLPANWSFQFDRAKVRFGKCHYARREISLSRFLVELNSESEVRETILHEIAHALASRRAGHGPVWQAIARSIGCQAARCYGDEVVRPAPKFKGTCLTCGQVILRHRRTLVACGRCSPVFDRRYLFTWS